MSRRRIQYNEKKKLQESLYLTHLDENCQWLLKKNALSAFLKETEEDDFGSWRQPGDDDPFFVLSWNQELHILPWSRDQQREPRIQREGSGP